MDLMFNLLILGSITDSTGNVWKKNEHQLYMIEKTLSEKVRDFLITIFIDNNF